jgi:hypothetical protein
MKDADADAARVRAFAAYNARVAVAGHVVGGHGERGHEEVAPGRRARRLASQPAYVDRGADQLSGDNAADAGRHGNCQFLLAQWHNPLWEETAFRGIPLLAALFGPALSKKPNVHG